MSQWEKVYGVHAVEALLRHHPKRVKQLWLAEGRHDPRVQVLTELAAGFRIPVGQRDRRELDEWAEGVHQGVVAEVSPSQVWGENMLEELLERSEGVPLLLALDGVTDPHNLGACLRTADAAGVQAVIVPKDKSATLNATVRKVACGAAEVIPLVAVTNLARTLEKLQQRGLWVVGTAGEADKTLYQLDLKGPTVLVMGAEGKGMRRLTREHCDFLARLPMAGSVSSLNVSVATGVCLFEIPRAIPSAVQIFANLPCFAGCPSLECRPLPRGQAFVRLSARQAKKTFTPCLTVLRQAATRKEHLCVITKSCSWFTRTRANKSVAWSSVTPRPSKKTAARSTVWKTGAVVSWPTPSTTCTRPTTF